jgi:hypothetical protein
MADEIWDEHDWEAFLSENDRRVDRFMALLADFMQRYPPPPEGAPPEEEEAWKARLGAYIRRRTGFEGSVDDLPVWEQEPEDAEPEDAEGEGWKAGLTAFPEQQSVDALPVYQAARALATTVLRWSEPIPADVKDGDFVQFCSNALQIAAKLSGGHAVGYERDMLGGNIAYVKRGLAAANAALDALHSLRGAPYLSAGDYHRLYEATYEVRNAVALHVLRLRERFERGTD